MIVDREARPGAAERGAVEDTLYLSMMLFKPAGNQPPTREATKTPRTSWRGGC